ncbi:UDP-N-acetylglucosamine--N-acetylmuramyl-(pentapeptide) pyrophosphoryl-undecaprenol N-acetylglucosamine transferase [Subtercola boreus]|uniref:UDP-N-acetylglucosamine--N-acetylmuramyl-(pentapeptide) pyrophosphoryl-undecaprenol N-acetylglucosamine transferase n=1 Tax=Subtercola boreus TaxID=120213 RepID=A0A3E0VI28_9MICO|nr:UDP-N-acetylglucosamine--N-acetylmuramyl-(pentapeptide) pyrophosphoryl-undecaprenol N-acetylglucosamine transferase [Subtercola boreus]RFA09153.1 UDP-N-acetylglucosamine--N-acetylmuramyl-(pentapeptide) pyrophosphoryl-undecaprenol N-acetylglucosamine transferase [Subtercola boreus]TQL53834.1 UDP-N-acetylglucosamine-N-acetylmuramylpentapeptide N-acetylglucosamine transferase [Subtercola boreus]
MTTYLLAGGGTAGHVNPLLATADELRRRDPEATIVVIGTATGLEARLVPERGYELVTIPKLPFPRRPNRAAAAFPAGLRRVIADLARLIRERHVDVVVGFGGYAAAPAYLAARRARVPLVIHEANARPGLANRLGARFTPYVGLAFRAGVLPHGRFVGMPLRREIQALAGRPAAAMPGDATPGGALAPDSAALPLAAARAEGLALFDLRGDAPVLLVTGGSLGAAQLNGSVFAAAADLVAAGWQVLHITGDRSELVDPGIPGYRMLRYCDRMELALAVADLAVSRAGAATVSELAALGVPSVLVPYAVGNGEQRFNAVDLVDAGGAVLVRDADFTPDWIRSSLLPLLSDRSRISTMAAAALGAGVTDGSARTVDLIEQALKGA